MDERGAEEFALTSRRNAGDHNDDAGVERFFSVEHEKIGAIICHESIVLPADDGHELPVFRTAQAKMVDMVGDVTGGVCQFHQGSMEAFIDQELYV